MKSKFATRRDACYFIGRRAVLLTPVEAAIAWACFAKEVEEMGEMDMPKFLNMLAAFRAATIVGKQSTVLNPIP